MLGDPCKHSRAYLFNIMERKHEVGPSLAGQRAMRARLTLDRPTRVEERIE